MKYKAIIILIFLIVIQLQFCKTDKIDRIKAPGFPVEFLLKTVGGQDFTIKNLCGFYKNPNAGILIFIPNKFEIDESPIADIARIIVRMKSDKINVKFAFISEMEIKDTPDFQETQEIKPDKKT